LRTDGAIVCWGKREGDTPLVAPVGSYEQMNTTNFDEICGITGDGSIVCGGLVLPAQL
jgi:hypothetical protein